jgi:hypothetical protein
LIDVATLHAAAATTDVIVLVGASPLASKVLVGDRIKSEFAQPQPNVLEAIKAIGKCMADAFA